ncbi:hypothetical protein ACQ4PT_002814 [Festuca glaucescens]
MEFAVVLGALGNVAAVTQLVGNAGGLISKIIKEAKTARQNKAECEHLASRVSTIGGVSRLPLDAEVAAPLAELNKILQETHRLVLSCQKQSAVNQLFRASHRADEFSKVNARINSDISVLILSLLIFIAHDERRQYAGGLISKIIKEAETARRNKVECKQHARSVVTICGVLSRLPPDPEVARPLAELNNTLEEAHELVVGCQKRSAISQIFRGSRRANRFREVVRPRRWRSSHASWFLTEERRSLLRASKLISTLDLDRVPTPPDSTPPRSAGPVLSDGEEVPDSPAASPSRSAVPAVGSGGALIFNAVDERGAITAPAAPALRSLIVKPASYPSSAPIHGTSTPSVAPHAPAEAGWVTVPERRRPRRDVHSWLPSTGAPSPTTRASQAEAAALRFKSRTAGRCARCLAPAHHHLATACRDKIRCLSCNLSGHKERHCHLRQAQRAARSSRRRPQPGPPPSSPLAPGARSWAEVAAASPGPPPAAPTAVASGPLLLPPPPPMAQSGIGSAATRPEEDTVIIASSFEIDQDIKDWEATAAIAWVINGNRKVPPIAIDRAIRKRFHLSHSELTICPHQPVQFLLKFVQKAHCSEVLKQGRIKADGALLQLRPWRPLEHAFGASMSYRVRLCLEGVPAYGLTPYVAERIIARRCSFDRLEDSSALLMSARSLDCWAWTANPSAIPKVVWLTFTSRGNGGPASEVFVHEVRPTGSKRGATFRVLVHLDQMEDCSMAPLDFFGSSSDAGAFRPMPVSFDWHYLTVDGMPPVPLQNEDDEETLQAAALARRDRRAKGDDHPHFHSLRRDDRDDDHDKDGAARRERRGLGELRDAEGFIRRDRTRSPRRRDAADAGHGQRRDLAPNADPPFGDVDMIPVPPAMELHVVLAEQAALLRADLLACLDGAVKPILAESEALRSWNARATAFLDGLMEKDMLRRASSTPSTRSTTAMDGGDAAAATKSPVILGMIHADAPIADTVKLFAQMDISTGNEAWNASEDSLPPFGPDHHLPASPERPMTMLDTSRGRADSPSTFASPDTPLVGSDRGQLLVATTMVTAATAMVTAPASAAPPTDNIITPAADDASARLLCFIDYVAAPIQQPLMSTPSAKKKKKVALPLASPRRSGRLAIKKKARSLADGAEAIQELIARVCGLLAPTATFDDAAKTAYQQLFINAPLAASAIHALEALEAGQEDGEKRFRQATG